MRRNIDQQDHQPRIGLLAAGNKPSVYPIFLDTSGDKLADSKIMDSDKLSAGNPLLGEFIEALGASLAIGSELFQDSLTRLLDNKEVSDPVRKIIRMVMRD